MGKKRRPEDRLWEKVNLGAVEDCWEWKQPVKNYYPSFTHGRCNGTLVTTTAHRAAYMFAFGPPPKGLYICHKCGNRKCVNPNHLYAATQKENIRDAIRHGTFKPPPVRHGSTNANAKLVEEEAQFIRKVYGDCPYWKRRDLAAAFGISRMTAYRISKGHAWNHVIG